MILSNQAAFHAEKNKPMLWDQGDASSDILSPPPKKKLSLEGGI